MEIIKGSNRLTKVYRQYNVPVLDIPLIIVKMHKFQDMYGNASTATVATLKFLLAT